MTDSLHTPGRERIELLDLLRGVAILLMMAFHFCYDLNYFGYIVTNFEFNPFWVHFRELIVSMFLLIAGISMTLSYQGWPPRKSYFLRLGLLVLYSALITLATWLVYPQYIITFGILHFIAVASVLGLAFRRFGKLNLVPALVFLFLPRLVDSDVFNNIWIEWVGLSSDKRPTLDQVHLFPWFGVYLLGMVLGVFIRELPEQHWFRLWKAQFLVSRMLCTGGRHSLHIYMIHQPVFLALIGGVYYLQFH